MATELPVLIGVDHASTPDQLVGDGAWDSASGTQTMNGSTPDRYLRMGDPSSRTLTLPSAVTRIAHGERFYAENDLSGQFWTYRNASAQEVLNVYYNDTDHTLSVRRGSTVLGTTTAEFFGAAAAKYLEISIVFDDAAGQVDIAVDGVIDVHLTGVDTINNAGPVVDILWAAAPSGGGNPHCLRDVYVKARASGSAPDFYGPLSFVPIHSTGDDSVAWTPSAGSVNSDMVDEAIHDGDSTNVETSTVDAVDLLDAEDLSDTGLSILALVLTATVKAPSGGAPVMALLIDDGVDQLVSSNRVVGNAAYGARSAVFLTQADGATAWTLSTLNGTKIGYKYVSAS